MKVRRKTSDKTINAEDDNMDNTQVGNGLLEYVKQLTYLGMLFKTTQDC